MGRGLWVEGRGSRGEGIEGVEGVFEISFNEACRRYRGELSEANIDITPNLLLKNRRSEPTDPFNAKDLVNLLRYVAGISTRFPKSVFSDVKTLVSVKNHNTQADLNKSHYTEQVRIDSAVEHPLSPTTDVNNLTSDTSLQEIIKQLEENQVELQNDEDTLSSSEPVVVNLDSGSVASVTSPISAANDALLVVLLFQLLIG